MSDLEKICSLFAKEIESINIAEYIPDYVLPDNKNQQFIDRLEFSMEASRNWEIELNDHGFRCKVGIDREIIDGPKPLYPKWRALIGEQIRGNMEEYTKIKEFETKWQKICGRYLEPVPMTEEEKKKEEWFLSPYNPDYCPYYNYICLWDVAFMKVNEKYPGQFKKGNIKGKVMTLLRIKPGKCIISGNHHTRENSYITVSENNKSFKFALGCNRGCTYSMRNIKLKNMGCTPKSCDGSEESD